MIKKYRENEIEKLANILEKDGVISIPTDTVYGVCARINSKKAHDKLMKVKNRKKAKIFPIMCANEIQIDKIAVVDEKAKKLIEAFMPGPITIILNKKEDLPKYINNGEKTIAIRMATSKTLENLLIKIDTPIFLSSANQSGKEIATNLEEIEKSCPMIDAILEGKVFWGKASTIIDCTKEEIKILREGPILEEEIRKVLKM